MNRLGLALIPLVIVGTALPASADEQMVPLAQSGQWITYAHQASITQRADVCVTANAVRGVGFRADADGIQIRVSNEQWSLPAGVQGSVAISVGSDWTGTFDIDDNTNVMVNAEIDRTAVAAMFAAMDKNSSMAVTVGKAKPLIVSLVGSTRATNAFRTCAGLEGNSPSPGSNPFE
jgi:hypothetical protein